MEKELYQKFLYFNFWGIYPKTPVKDDDAIVWEMEKSLWVFLEILGYKRKTEDKGGDSDSKHQGGRRVKTTTAGEPGTFFWQLSRLNLIPC